MAGFWVRAAALWIFFCGVVYGQDIVYRNIQSGDFYRIKIGDSRYGWVVSQTWSRPSIPVCWESVPAEYAAHRETVKDAVAKSWEAHSAVRFTGWDVCPSRNFSGIRIRVANENPHVRRLGAPISGLRGGMVLNFTFDMDDFRPCLSSNKMYTMCIRSIAVHEFGHALGFAHEHNRSDRDVACAKKAQGPDGNIELTPYDPESVMNYCNPQYNNYGMLSEKDIISVQAIYGK